jgi:hypothetical protein
MFFFRNKLPKKKPIRTMAKRFALNTADKLGGEMTRHARHFENIFT